MKSPLNSKHIFIALLALALAQFACSFSGGASSPEPLQAPTSGPQVTQAPAASSDRGTPEEAQAMLQKAVAYYNTVGRKKALDDFNNRVTPFFDRDLYVACIDSHLIIDANGGFPNLVGSTVEPLSRAKWDSAAKGHVDSINYAWLNPVSKQTEPKTFYYEKVGEDVCGVGAYHP